MDTSSTTRSYKISGMTSLSVGPMYCNQMANDQIVSYRTASYVVVQLLLVTDLLLFGTREKFLPVWSSPYNKRCSPWHHAASSPCQRCTPDNVIEPCDKLLEKIDTRDMLMQMYLLCCDLILFLLFTARQHSLLCRALY